MRPSAHCYASSDGWRNDAQELPAAFVGRGRRLALRKDFEGLTKGVGDADPASVGFFRNNLTSADTWAVEGTLGLPMPMPFAPEGLAIGNYAVESAWFVPAVGLNRVVIAMANIGSSN